MNPLVPSGHCSPHHSSSFCNQGLQVTSPLPLAFTPHLCPTVWNRAGQHGLVQLGNLKLLKCVVVGKRRKGEGSPISLSPTGGGGGEWVGATCACNARGACSWGGEGGSGSCWCGPWLLRRWTTLI